MFVLKNKIQHFSWGSKTLIPNLMKIPCDGKNYAELWMGAHPSAPSTLILEEKEITLPEYINKNPQKILGEECYQKFKQLPYLFKLLSAQEPLSIQAHPNKQQAEEGFQKENNLNIPLTSSTRNYKDNNHKPETIVALTPFWAMCGFRPLEEIKNKISSFIPQLDYSSHQTFFNTIMTLREEEKRKAISQIENLDNHNAIKQEELQWVKKLIKLYPQDIAIFSPLYLNLIQLQPKEALFLTSGILHAYLEGMGIELMANSDNVLRGGLTPKHQDLNEMLKNLNFTSHPIDILKPQETDNPSISKYKSLTEEFILEHWHLEGNSFSQKRAEVLIIFMTEGEATFFNKEKTEKLKQGQSLFIEANEEFTIEGHAQLYVALNQIC